MASFFSMGGYAAFVWPAYGLSVIGLTAALLLSLRSYRLAKERLAALQRGGR